MTTKSPSGRSGPLDGLPSGQRTAATWLPDWRERTDCCHRNRHCRGPKVEVHHMFDDNSTNRTMGGGTFDQSTTVTCLAHAISRHGLHPGGEPTDAYRAAVGAGQ